MNKKKAKQIKEPLYIPEIVYNIIRILSICCFVAGMVLLLLFPSIADAASRVEYAPQTLWDSSQYSSYNIAQKIKLKQINNAKNADNIYNAIDILPDVLVQNYIDNKWTITATNNIQSYSQTKSPFTRGVCSFKKSGIFISTKLFTYDENKVKYDTTQVILHEFGHYADYTTSAGKEGASSDEESFAEIFNQEKDIFFEKFFKQERNDYNVHELFADAFFVMMYNPDKLKEQCPQTYEYVYNTIDTFVKTSTQEDRTDNNTNI